MKTKMLYMEDNYIQEFTAKVLKTGEDFIVLDQTAFYPEGGGQESDAGIISYNGKEYTVRKVKKVSGEVRHYLTTTDNLPKKDEVVKGKLDWDKRYTHMRYHTAIHILSTYMKDTFDAEVVGNNISTRKGRADFNLEIALTDDQLTTIEKGINEVIKRNLDVTIRFMPRDDAKAFLEEKGYQTDYIEMVPKSVKIFRVISCGDYDHASCAGTHVKNTSEIGVVKVIKRRSMGKGKERVTLSLA